MGTSPKDVVKELMTFTREEEREIMQCGAVVRSKVPHLIYACPHGASCRIQVLRSVFKKPAATKTHSIIRFRATREKTCFH